MLSLLQWAMNGNVSALELLIQKEPELLKSRDEGGASLIHHATAGAALVVIRLIVATVGLEGEKHWNDHFTVKISSHTKPTLKRPSAHQTSIIKE